MRDLRPSLFDPVREWVTIVTALALLLVRGICSKNRGHALAAFLYQKAGALLLEEKISPTIALTPTAIERLAHFLLGQVVEAHRDLNVTAEFAGK